MPATAAVTCHLAGGLRCLGVLLSQAPGFNKPGKSKAPDQSPVSHVSLTLIQVRISCLITQMLFFVDSVDGRNIYRGCIYLFFAGVGVEAPERDCLEKDEDNPEREREMGEPECEPVDNSMEDKLGLGLGLGIGPPPPSERWLPPSPLYSAPFLNGSPQPSSPQPSLGAQQGPLEAPPRSSWLEDELRGLGEAAIQLGNRVEKSLREFGEGFRQDMRTLVASQEALAVSLQQNNVLLQRLLGVLEAQQQPQPQQHRVQQAHQSQTSQQHLQPQPSQQQLQNTESQQQCIETPQQTQQQHQQHQSQQHQTQIQQQPQVTQHSNNQSGVVVVPAPSSPDVHGTFPSNPPTDTNGSLQRPRRGRAVDHRRRRRR